MKLMMDDRELNLDPIAVGGIGPCEAIMLLRAGQPVGWTIEPGDMTRYKVLLVPCWSSPHMSVVSGISGPDVNAFILLTYVSDTMPFSRAVGQWCQQYDLVDHGIKNEWTARMLSALVRAIFTCLMDDSIDPAEYVHFE